MTMQTGAMINIVFSSLVGVVTLPVYLDAYSQGAVLPIPEAFAADAAQIGIHEIDPLTPIAANLGIIAISIVVFFVGRWLEKRCTDC